MKRFLLVPMMLLLVHAVSEAQGFWQPIREFQDGTITSVASASDGTLFAASGMGVYRSDDAGKSWYLINSNRIDELVISEKGSMLARDSRQDLIFRVADGGGDWSLVGADLLITAMVHAGGEVFLQAGGNLLERSTDGGKSWGLVNTARITHSVRGKNGLVYKVTRSGISASADSGATWGQETNVPAAWNNVMSVAVTENGTMLVATDNAVHRSTDGGATWSEVASLFATRIVALEGSDLVMVVNDPWPFNSARNGLYRSTDNGATWMKLPVAGAERIFPGRNGALFLSGHRNLSRSDDGGLTWTEIDSGLSNYSAQIVSARGPQGIYVALHGKLYSHGLGQTTLLNDTIARIIHAAESADIFAERERVELSPPDIAETRHDLVHSTDGGRTWSYIGTGKSVASSFAGRFVAGLDPEKKGDSGTVLYKPYGSTIWNTARLPWGVNAVWAGDGNNALATAGTADDAGSASGGIFRTTDAGTTWRQVMDGVLASSIVAGPNSALLVVGEPIVDGRKSGDIQLYASSDGGEHWAVAGDSMPYSPGELRRNGDDLEYETAEGIMRSHDDGKTWERIPWADGPVTAITPRWRQQVFGVARNGRMYGWLGWGRTWAPLEEGLPNGYMNVGHHAVLGGDGNLYLSVSGYGVFKSAYYVMSVPHSGWSDAGMSSLGESHPNPVSSSAIIPFEIPVAGHVMITLHDLLGREVARPADGDFSAGPHQIRFDAGELPAGVYYCRLSNGSTVESRPVVVAR